ncbi:MAG: EutN/CcmL family microcompartment protein, partial [Firmicutes bacterium]|nr:EutN/CcmL family microcompartment protein [Bacillota bacterium]
MMLARVVGNVVATQKKEDLHGKKLLLVQPVDLDGRPAGGAVLAVDGVG